MRRAWLRSAGIELPDEIGEAGSVPADDLLDAGAAAWTARRVVNGQAVPLPEGAHRGDPMVIWR